MTLDDRPGARAGTPEARRAPASVDEPAAEPAAAAVGVVADATADDTDPIPVATPTDQGARPRRRRLSPTRNLIEWIVVIGGALAIALVIRTFFLSAFYIPSGSMERTLDVSDRVLVNKLSYRLHDLNRGDVVVFERPPGESDRSIKDLIKRVVGLPGETVQGLDGTVYVCEQGCSQPALEGKPLTEQYVNAACGARGYGNTTDFGPVTLAGEEAWVMGDNRCDSADSRVFGPITTGSIVGRAFVVVWPFGHLSWL